MYYWIFDKHGVMAGCGSESISELVLDGDELKKGKVTYDKNRMEWDLPRGASLTVQAGMAELRNNSIRFVETPCQMRPRSLYVRPDRLPDLEARLLASADGSKAKLKTLQRNFGVEGSHLLIKQAVEHEPAYSLLHDCPDDAKSFIIDEVSRYSGETDREVCAAILGLNL